MRKILFFLLLAANSVQAQELFAFTEPASNMPTNSLGVRFSNYLMQEKNSNHYNYHLVPEVMFGTNKKLMIHADGFFSNDSKSFTPEGFSVYGKYRFLADDAVHSHFRMAAFARLSYNNSYIQQQEIDLYGYNSGWQTGVVATQLLHKIALSASASYVHATDNGDGNKIPSAQSKNAADYTLSFGKLVLPKQYTDYQQTNLNLLCEFLGQTLSNGNSYLDAAPALQLIFNSQARVDIGYRKQLYTSINRSAPDGFLIRVEYLFFNVFK